jgi:hypothetical protein
MSFQYKTHPADNDANRLKQRLRGFTDAVLGSPAGSRDELGTITAGLREAYLEGVRKGADAPRLYRSELDIGTEVVDLFDGRVGVVTSVFVVDDKGFDVEQASVDYRDELSPSSRDVDLINLTADLSILHEGDNPIMKTPGM